MFCPSRCIYCNDWVASSHHNLSNIVEVDCSPPGNCSKMTNLMIGGCSEAELHSCWPGWVSCYAVDFDAGLATQVPYWWPTRMPDAALLFVWEVLFESPDQSSWWWIHHVLGFPLYFQSRKFRLILLAYHRIIRQFHLEAVLLLERRGDWKWCFKDEWRRLPQSSKILQWTIYRSLYAGFYNLESEVLPLRCKVKKWDCFRSASGHGLSPRIMPISISRWQFFCQFIFCWALRAFLSLSDCDDEHIFVSSYMGSNGRSSISGFGPSKVSRIIFSSTSSVNWYCTLHFSQQRGGSCVDLSQKASIPSAVRLFAGCAMSYTIWIR